MDIFRIRYIVNDTYVISTNDNKYISFTNDSSLDCIKFNKSDADKLFNKLNSLEEYSGKLILEKVEGGANE